MKLPRLDLKKIVTLGSVVTQLVHAAQKNKEAKGIEKHEQVRDTVLELLPVLEGVTGLDITDARLKSGLDRVISLEKTAMNALQDLDSAKADLQFIVDELKAQIKKD